MSKIAQIGEIHDDVVYTHKRLAVILDRSEEWVFDNLIKPAESSGVQFRKAGTIYFLPGECVRAWVQGDLQCLSTEKERSERT
jgi:hypothetical protein